MIEVAIPGRGALALHHAAFDVNGTLATDGELIEGVAALTAELGQRLTVHLLTADTHGKQAAIDAQLGLKARIITQGAPEKAAVVRALGGAHVVAIGNGANDAPMFEAAALSIAVLGEEGLAVETLQAADIVVRHIHDALRLLLSPNRLVASLRR
ncbi:MAG: HAD hydrolase family protein [Anaerolineae bacterium]|nr:HAD hydrolase family protein [Anaerolineae bacterium]